MYGPDKAAAILDNCGVEVVFGTKDNQLCNELSERLGYDTVDGVSRSGPRVWRVFRNKNLNQSESDQKRALLLPQEIMRLKPRDAIIIRPGMYPITAKRIRYFKDRTFTRLLRKAPVVEPIEVVVRMDQGKGFEPQAPAQPPEATVQAPKPKAAKKSTAVTSDQGETAASADTSSEGGKAKSAKSKPAKKAAGAGDAPEAIDPPTLRPHQADGLLKEVLGAEVDIGEFALEDGKAAVAALLKTVPSVELLNRGRSVAAERRQRMNGRRSTC